MSDSLKDVVIIGAGLGVASPLANGCALALALSARDIPVRIYESRPADAPVIASGVILTPNGLCVLDSLGVLSRIQSRCYKATHRIFKDHDDNTTRKTLISGESLYGYANHWIWRSLLLDEMKQMLSERSINIHYNSKFNAIISDSSDGVGFRIGEEQLHAKLLVGMDGIYSTVRNYLAPEVRPEYTGTLGVLSHIKRASVAWPYPDYEMNATIQDRPGAIFFLPEDPEGEEIMVGMQKQCPGCSRDELDKLQRDKDQLIRFYPERYDEWGATARSIIDRVAENKEQCFIWPFLKVPMLPRWFSDTGRVILCGDAAHGLPPSSGQGINQALEDIYTLTLLLDHAGRLSNTANGGSDKNQLLDASEYWKTMRQQRVDAVFDWATNSQNVERLSDEERKRRVGSQPIRKGDDMSWLYAPRLEGDVQAWIAAHP